MIKLVGRNSGKKSGLLAFRVSPGCFVFWPMTFDTAFAPYVLTLWNESDLPVSGRVIVEVKEELEQIQYKLKG